VEITITDSGKGVTEHEKKQLFNAFFQAESGLTRSFKGTGLGLSIVKAIVDHYHGEIDIQSSPHVGTKIKVSLALSADQKEYEKPSVLLDCNVLAMVNGIMEKQTLSSQLQMAGAKVDLARSGDDLVKQCSEQQYDFVILDIQDPNKNAIMILEDKNFTYPKEKVIVLMPAVHRESDVEKCHQLGVYNLVYKPFSLNKFLESTYKLEEVPKETLSQGEELSILVVDDDEENRELIRAYLANLPFQMEFAENGMQAIEKSDSDNFDMILMDIEMPELNGYDTAVRILKSPHQRKLKILGLSANAFAENLNKAEECGFSGYITKPIRKEKLVKAITECYHNDQFYKM
ncbi:MAG: response regulator, partial [Bdellovibrionales bacterium]|nr:response regulator [Bdellovibrionales bacterium]